jgi:hypothetical protein
VGLLLCGGSSKGHSSLQDAVNGCIVWLLMQAAHPCCCIAGPLIGAAWKRLLRFVDQQMAPLLPVPATDARVTDAAAEQLLLFNLDLASLLCLTASSTTAARSQEAAAPPRQAAQGPANPLPCCVMRTLRAAVQSSGAFAEYTTRLNPGGRAIQSGVAMPRDDGRGAPTMAWVPKLLAYFEGLMRHAPGSPRRTAPNGSPHRPLAFATALRGLEDLYSQVSSSGHHVTGSVDA